MMANLFSIFDPSTNSIFQMNWISSLMVLFSLPNLYWLSNSRSINLFKLINNKIINELNVILLNKFNKMNMIFLMNIFLNIMLNNLYGLFPYIFTSSSHLIYSLSISMPMWLSFMIFGYYNNFNSMFAHMIPQNTPNILMPFMVIIESTSNIIRPFTLSIRLTANMIAGHLLITLLSQSAMNSMIIISINIIYIQIILLILEFSVSIIQAYVFMVLITLYAKETNYD